MFPDNVDLSNPLGIIAFVVSLIGTGLAIGVPALKARSESKKNQVDAGKVQAEIQQIVDATTRARFEDMQAQINELRKGRVEDREKINVLSAGFRAQSDVIERSRGHAKPTDEEQALIDAAKSLID